MNVQAVLDDLEGFERALGERLIEAGKLEPAGLDRALKLRAESGERLSALLPKLGLVSERRLDSRPPWLSPPRGAARSRAFTRHPRAVMA